MPNGNLAHLITSYTSSEGIDVDDDFSEIYRAYTGPLGSNANNAAPENKTTNKRSHVGLDEEEGAHDPNAVPINFTSRGAKVWEAKSKATEKNWKKRKEEEMICKICGESGHFTQGCPSTLGGNRKSQDFFETEDATEREKLLDEAVDEILKDDPTPTDQPPSTSALCVDDSELQVSLQLKGKELSLDSDVQTPPHPAEPDVETAERNFHLEVILSSLHTIRKDLGKLSTEQSITSSSVDTIKDSVNSRLKSFSKDLSDLSSSLESKIRVDSLNQLQSQTLLSDKLDSMNTRFDAIDAKLATLTAALLSQAKQVMIAKKGENGSGKPEDTRKATDDLSKKRTEPDSSRKDKGPVDKHPRH